MTTKTVLAIGAHPDDTEVSMFGTLAAYRALGWRVVCCVAADCSPGDSRASEVRRSEALAAAVLLDAQVEFLGETDGLLAQSPTLHSKVTGLIQSLKPSAVLTHSDNDYHPDHRVLSTTVFDAASFGIPVLFADNLAGVQFEPQYYVDITNHQRLKHQAILAHQSQQSTEIAEMTELLNRFRGMQCGWRRTHYAEAFRSKPRYAHVNYLNILPSTDISGSTR